ncbi:DNA repair protein Rad26 [Cordyceps fumosorosea ARSEF 2679]|uniref:DNA repair protein Rad26 n=1 Tax=Cordyceps fumosorosea (strain ARSEF 2679) TaxID=1081104 RepID=A0A168B6S2_CORFA|nr:DNA repair protein Rad26 [Cordyceps fumosorosea ARSEF 2679]OAA69698.1 DNA repair protein Rad26 [Cordyceps fumosorosea ARSEF 2679]
MDLDEFSDDGLDDLPENALREIENQATQFTQAQQHAQLTQNNHPRSSVDARAQQSDYGWEEDDDLDTAQVVNDAGVPVGGGRRPGGFPQTSSVTVPIPPPNPPRRPIPPVPNPQWNPTVAQNASRPNATQQLHPPRAGILPAAAAAASQRFNPSQAASGGGGGQAPLLTQTQPGDVLTALQIRIRALEYDLNAARGEASIIRANSVKAQREFDAQVARLKRANAEQLEAHGRAVDAAVAAERSAHTELQFLQQDMKEVISDSRARRKDGAGGGPAAGNIATTPKKAGGRSWGIADGFDEMDVAMSSPSKGRGRGGRGAGSVAANVGERTPTKGKRKRPVMDSPVAALEVDTADIFMADDKLDLSKSSQHHVAAAPPAAPYEFLQLILDHGCFPQQPPTFDILSRFSFPSDTTSASLASKIFERLPLMGNPHQSMQLQVDFAETVIRLWSRCFEEQYWAPVKYLMPLLSFTFQLHVTSVAPLVARDLVPVAQSTICLVADALQSRQPDGSFPNQQEYKYYEEHIDTAEAMALLHMCALACATSHDDGQNGMEHGLSSYWKLMSLDMVVILLSPKQRFHDIVNMLDLLSTSSLPDSIGPITEEKDAQLVARIIIERVSARLIEGPRSPHTQTQKKTIRTTALRTLIAFARYPFGAMQLAVHDNAIPRLMTCLSTSIDELYDQPVSSALLPEPPAPTADDDDDVNAARGGGTGVGDDDASATPELSRNISQCVLLLHALVTDPHTADAADVSRKLSVFHGGSQRQLLALGRLTFAEEDLVMEAGIDSEIVEAAHELLELAVSPDEGEVVSEAFGP